MHAVDFSGEVILFDGPWASRPSGGSGDVFQNDMLELHTNVKLFLQVGQFVCSSVRLQVGTCTDKKYALEHIRHRRLR